MGEDLIRKYREQVLSPIIHDIQKQSGEAMVAAAASLCPVKTGRLRASIGYEYDPETFEVTVYAAAPYATAVEMGYQSRTGKIMPPHPFLRPCMSAASSAWSGKPTVVSSGSTASGAKSRTTTVGAIHRKPRMVGRVLIRKKSR